MYFFFIDHMIENRMALRFAQEKAKQEREMEALCRKDYYKLEQFRNVPARVYEEAPNSPRRSARCNADDESLESKGVFLQRGTADRRLAEQREANSRSRQVIKDQIEDARYIANRPNTPTKGPTPKANERGMLKPKENENWIARNRQAADEMEAKSTMTQRERGTKEAAHHESFGRVPEYLQQRKAQMQQEKEDALARKPDPNCPKGMKLMPNDERLQTLDVLKASREEAINQLARMPFILETPTAKRKHTELEMKLKEIEAALALFSKQKVYIAIDR
jgi:hypothetical protein